MLLSKQNAQLSAISETGDLNNSPTSYLQLDPGSNTCAAVNRASIYISAMPDPGLTDDFPQNPMILPDASTPASDPNPLYVKATAVQAAVKTLQKNKDVKSSPEFLQHILVQENKERTHYLLETNDLTTVSIVSLKNEDSEIHSLWPSKSQANLDARANQPNTGVSLAVSSLIKLIKIAKAHHVDYLALQVFTPNQPVVFSDTNKQLKAYIMPYLPSY